MNGTLQNWFDLHQNRILQDFFDYLAVDTSLGKEGDAFPFLERYLASAGFDTRRELLHPALQKHPAFSPHPLSICTHGRENLRAVYRQASLSGRRTLFNCHVDVVPPGRHFDQAFAPRLTDGRIYARGACDTKGNLVMLVETLRFLESIGEPLQRKLLLDLPIEEEVGGNGTLSTILHGVEADEIVVMEPTNLQIYRGHRGCVTARFVVSGTPKHMGSADHASSAIHGAVRIIRELERVEQEFLDDAKSSPGFEIWQRPVQLNVGTISGGEWAGSIPERCVLTANVGYLPVRSMQDVERRLTDAATHALQGYAALSVDVDFHSGLRNQAFLTPPPTALVADLSAAAGTSPAETFGWRVSCDAHHYHHVAALPTVVFGAGELDSAHSSDEHLALEEFVRGMSILAAFLTAPPSSSGPV